MSRLRTWITLLAALAIGGLVAAAALALGTMYVTIISAGQSPEHHFVPRNFLLFFPILAIVTIAAALAIGVPMFYLLRHFRALNWLTASLVGAAAGPLVVVGVSSSSLPLESVVLYAAVGAAAAYTGFLVLRSNLSFNADPNRRASGRAGGAG